MRLQEPSASTERSRNVFEVLQQVQDGDMIKFFINVKKAGIGIEEAQVRRRRSSVSTLSWGRGKARSCRTVPARMNSPDAEAAVCCMSLISPRRICVRIRIATRQIRVESVHYAVREVAGSVATVSASYNASKRAI